MNVNKNVTIDNFDEFIKLITKLRKEKKSFNFNGNINISPQVNNENYTISWITEEEI